MRLSVLFTHFTLAKLWDLLCRFGCGMPGLVWTDIFSAIPSLSFMGMIEPGVPFCPPLAVLALGLCQGLDFPEKYVCIWVGRYVRMTEGLLQLLYSECGLVNTCLCRFWECGSRKVTITSKFTVYLQAWEGLREFAWGWFCSRKAVTTIFFFLEKPMFSVEHCFLSLFFPFLSKFLYIKLFLLYFFTPHCTPTPSPYLVRAINKYSDSICFISWYQVQQMRGFLSWFSNISKSTTKT